MPIDPAMLATSIGALGDLDPEESSSADFSDSTVTLTHTVAWFPGAGGAVEQLFRDVAAACAQVVAPDGSVSIRAGGLNFGVLSDDTLAIRFEVEPKEGAITERDVLVSIGRGEDPDTEKVADHLTAELVFASGWPVWLLFVLVAAAAVAMVFTKHRHFRH